MKLNKTSLQSDKIANLYRAAASLAGGDQATALNFIKKSANFAIAKQLSVKLPKNQQLLLAEKILDQYHQTLSS
ncbi:hypothetical protein KKE48_00065 [Patescibacteria group bacterium]|nr:hypothetical protein [Patescibacteria group bacterium]MBU1499250.1 hypothetical protein [Patescibacteria group bacterium]